MSKKEWKGRTGMYEMMENYMGEYKIWKHRNGYVIEDGKDSSLQI